MNKMILLVGVIVLGLCTACSTSLFANVLGPRLEGAWQPDDYGTRIEITGDTMLILWRNAPVLETKFTVSREDGKYVLHLEKTEQRDARDGRLFAHVTGCWVEDGKMHLLQHFEIAGDDEEILMPTKESRYGDVTLVTEKYLPRIRGLWRTKGGGGWEIEIVGETLRCRGLRDDKWRETIPIVVTRDNDDPERIRIVHKDPSEEHVSCFFDLKYVKDRLVAHEIIADGDSPKLVFEKVK